MEDVHSYRNAPPELMADYLYFVSDSLRYHWSLLTPPPAPSTASAPWRGCSRYPQARCGRGRNATHW